MAAVHRMAREPVRRASKADAEDAGVFRVNLGVVVVVVVVASFLGDAVGASGGGGFLEPVDAVVSVWIPGSCLMGVVAPVDVMAVAVDVVDADVTLADEASTPVSSVLTRTTAVEEVVEASGFAVFGLSFSVSCSWFNF